MRLGDNETDYYAPRTAARGRGRRVTTAQTLAARPVRAPASRSPSGCSARCRAIAAVAMVLARNAVHAALFLAAVMLSLAGLYAAQDAPFLAAVQVIVYTGAILMLFLFVLMLVGVDTSDSLVETLRGQRVAALRRRARLRRRAHRRDRQRDDGTTPSASTEVNAEGNVVGLARLLFTSTSSPSR